MLAQLSTRKAKREHKTGVGRQDNFISTFFSELLTADCSEMPSGGYATNTT
jgi:hypothetical protein